jgi:hypothetical protein
MIQGAIRVHSLKFAALARKKMADPKKGRPLLTYEKHRDLFIDYCLRLGLLFF